MTQIILNKFEKEKRVIELHLQGKIREIAKEVHMSFRDIGRIKKTYEKKQNVALKEKLKTDSSHIKKKLSKSSQAFKLFRDGKKLTGCSHSFTNSSRKSREIMVTIHDIGKNV